MTFSPNGSYSPPSRQRTREPQKNELRLYEFIRSQEKPVSFYEIESELKMSSGAVQATIKRCLRPDAPYRIFENAIVSTKTKRKTRIFSANPNLFAQNQDILDYEMLYLEHQKIFNGDLVEDKDAMILPLRLDKKTTTILTILTKLDPSLQTIGALFSNAVITYIKTHISKENLDKAKAQIKETTD